MKLLLNLLPLGIIKNAIQFSTQCAYTLVSTIMKNTCRSHLLDLNIKRRNDPVDTDTAWCVTSAFDDESKHAQAFVSTKKMSLMFVE